MPGVYIGSLDYSGPTEFDITYWTFQEDGQLVYQHSTKAGTNPSWMVLLDRYLFVTNEVSSGSIVSFCRISENKLQLINQSVVEGSAPTHLTVNPGCRKIYSSNYSSGSLSVLPFEVESGSLKGVSQLIVDDSSEAPRDGAHVHQTIVYKNIATYIDLGLDTIFQYHINPSTGELLDANGPINVVHLPDGYGPRHMAFHPVAPFAFLINEYSCCVTKLCFDRETGRLTLPENASKSIISGVILYHSLTSHNTNHSNSLPYSFIFRLLLSQ